MGRIAFLAAHHGYAITIERAGLAAHSCIDGSVDFSWGDGPSPKPEVWEEIKGARSEVREAK